MSTGQVPRPIISFTHPSFLLSVPSINPLPNLLQDGAPFDPSSMDLPYDVIKGLLMDKYTDKWERLTAQEEAIAMKVRRIYQSTQIYVPPSPPPNPFLQPHKSYDCGLLTSSTFSSKAVRPLPDDSVMVQPPPLSRRIRGGAATSAVAVVAEPPLSPLTPLT